MNEKHGELTSALLDGELDSDAQQRVVAAMLDSVPHELERFGRYRLIGDVLRDESTVLAADVAERVGKALQDEPVVFAPSRTRGRQWLRPVAGLAVAASVAAVAVVVAPQLLTQEDQEAQSPQLSANFQRPAIAPTFVATGPTASQAQTPRATDAIEGNTRWQALNKDLEARLNRLVIEHHEFGGRSGINGPVPHIGFVSYEER